MIIERHVNFKFMRLVLLTYTSTKRNKDVKIKGKEGENDGLKWQVPLTKAATLSSISSSLVYSGWDSQQIYFDIAIRQEGKCVHDNLEKRK